MIRQSGMPVVDRPPYAVGWCHHGTNNVEKAFRSVTHTCSLTAAAGQNPPRLHDLRHSFAVNALLDAHRSGADVDAQIAALATYLGHSSPASTYWYLTASPELLDLVNTRVEAHREGHRT